MIYEMQVIRHTKNIEISSVSVDAASLEEAKQKISGGIGDFHSLDSDEIIDSEIVSIEPKS